MTFSNIEGGVSESAAIFVPAPAEVDAAVEPALDEEPSWRNTESGPSREGRRRSVLQVLEAMDVLTSVLCRLVTEDLVRGEEGVGLDQVHLRVSSSTAEDVLTLFT